MLPLYDRARIEENCLAVAKQTPISGSLRRRFAHGIRSLLGTPLEIDGDTARLTMGRKPWCDFLIERQVIPSNNESGVLAISADDRARIQDEFAAMRAFLKRVNPQALGLLDLLIAEIAVFQVERPEAGSHSAAIGFLWLNVRAISSAESLAELVFHEVLHNVVFLEDMVRGLMPEMELLEREDTRAYSAVRQTSRYFDSAFHAACVAAGMMWFHHRCVEHACSGHTQQIDHYLQHGRLAVADLIRVVDQQLNAGRPILSPNGNMILAGMADFFALPDFEAMDAQLSLSLSTSLV